MTEQQYPPPHQAPPAPSTQFVPPKPNPGEQPPVMPSGAPYTPMGHPVGGQPQQSNLIKGIPKDKVYPTPEPEPQIVAGQQFYQQQNYQQGYQQPMYPQQDYQQGYQQAQPSYQQQPYQQGGVQQGYQQVQQPYQQQQQPSQQQGYQQSSQPYQQVGAQQGYQQVQQPYQQDGAQQGNQQGSSQQGYQQSGQPSTQQQGFQPLGQSSAPQSYPTPGQATPPAPDNFQQLQGSQAASPQQAYQQAGHQQVFGQQQSGQVPGQQASQAPLYQQQGQYPAGQQWHWPESTQAPVKNRFILYVVLGVLEMILFGVFGFLALPGVVYALLMNNAYVQGNMELFKKNMRISRIWLIVGLCVGVICSIIYAVMIITGQTGGTYY